MPSLTLKNVPADVLARLKRRAAANRRSLNQEVLYLLERTETAETDDERQAREAMQQVAAWKALADPDADWPTESTADEILRSRTFGRPIDL